MVTSLTFSLTTSNICPGSSKWWPRQSDVLPPTAATIWWKGHRLITRLVSAWDSAAIDYFLTPADEQFMSKNTRSAISPHLKKKKKEKRINLSGVLSVVCGPLPGVLWRCICLAAIMRHLLFLKRQCFLTVVDWVKSLKASSNPTGTSFCLTFVWHFLEVE